MSEGKIEITLDPKEIDQALAEAILKADLGMYVKQAIDKALNQKTEDWGKKTLFERAIGEVIEKAVRDIAIDRVREQIVPAVEAALANAHFMSQAVEEAVKHIVERIVKDR